MSTTIELEVTGMTCGHCVSAVTNAIESVAGVQRANVDLEGGKATVEMEDADVTTIIGAIKEEGYEAAVR